MLGAIYSAVVNRRVIDLRVCYYGLLAVIITCCSIYGYHEFKSNQRKKAAAVQQGQQQSRSSLTKTDLYVFLAGLTGCMMVVFRKDILKCDPSN